MHHAANQILPARWHAPSVQQGTCVAVLQHLTGPPGGGQFIVWHPVGQPMGATLSVALLLAATLAFFFLAFFGVSLGVAACSVLVEAGGLAASAAQAGAAKARTDNNSNRYFIFMITLPLWLKNKYGLPIQGPQDNNTYINYFTSQT